MIYFQGGEDYKNHNNNINPIKYQPKGCGIYITNKMKNPHNWRWIKLMPNNKNPQDPWGGKKAINKKYIYNGTPPPLAQNNWGVITGKYNNIFVLDIDSAKWVAGTKKGECRAMLDYGEHPFLTKFGTNWKNFNTYSIRTRSGGAHIYFKWDADMKLLNHTCDYFQIDIRATGGYVVGEGSYAFDKFGADGGHYECVNDVPVAECPPELKEWITFNIRDKGFKQAAKYSKTAKEKKCGVMIKKINSKYKNSPVDNRLWRYNITDSEVLNIVGNLPTEYFTNYSDWIKLTTFFKILDRKHLWEQICKSNEGYNYEGNEKAWAGVNAVNLEIVKHILIMAQADWILPYIKHKPILIDSEQPTHTITRNKLGINEAGEQVDFIKELGDFKIKVIKSDTGTGKTTAFKKYIKNERKHFISIVSRKSLGQEQYRTFNAYGIDTHYYEEHPWCNQDDNYIVTIDSFFNRCCDIDFDDYVIFFDEWSSILDYLIDSGTIKNSRVRLTKFLVKAIKTCGEAILVDADINDNTFIALRFMTAEPILYIKNDFKHNGQNGGVPMLEFNQEDSLIKKLKGMLGADDKWILCCDSAGIAKHYYEILGGTESYATECAIKIYIAEDCEGDLIMDDHKKIIISPKVLYGLDSIMPREIFCLYKEHTITPAHMLQQISRCRNIIKLYYLFTKKRIKMPKYKTLGDTIKHLNEGNEQGVKEFGHIKEEDLNELYLHLLARIEFNNDAYSTNKFAHFIRIAQERGFKNINRYNKTEVNKELHKKIGKILKERDEENFDPTDERWERLNEVMKFTPEQAIKYKAFYLEKDALRQHFRISDYFFKGEKKIFKQLTLGRDFNIKTIRSEASRSYFLMNYIKIINPQHTNVLKRPLITTPCSKGLSKSINKGYELVFNKNLKKPIDLTKEFGCDKLLNKIYKQLFNDVLQVKRGRSYKGCYKDPEKIKRADVWNLMPNIISGHKEIYDIRQGLGGKVLEFLPEEIESKNTAKHAYEHLEVAQSVAEGIEKYFVVVK